jgi:hypothetical protein
MEDINSNTKNFYIARRLLSACEKRPGGHFEYWVGGFGLKIFTDKIQEHAVSPENDRITFHDKLDVHLYELVRDPGGSGRKIESYVHLEKDSRFSEYEPIKYHKYAGLSDGSEMPINNLCELVIYLHRLQKIIAFL